MSSSTTSHDLERSCPSLSDSTVSFSSSSCSASSLSPQADLLSPTSASCSDSDDAPFSLPQLERLGYPSFAATPYEYSYAPSVAPKESKEEAEYRLALLVNVRTWEEEHQASKRVLEPPVKFITSRPLPFASTLAPTHVNEEDRLGSVPMQRTKAQKGIPRSWEKPVASPAKVISSDSMSGQSDQYDVTYKFSLEAEHGAGSKSLSATLLHMPSNWDAREFRRGGE